jgi:hypothetical protein
VSLTRVPVGFVQTRLTCEALTVVATSPVGAIGSVVTFPHSPTDGPPAEVAVTSTQYVVAPDSELATWLARTEEPPRLETVPHVRP